MIAIYEYYMDIKKLSIILVHIFIGWALCGATVWIGSAVTSMQNALIIHAIAVPIILGIGIDDGTHIIYTFRSNPDKSPSLTISEIGPAIFLTSVTSMIGFGCLAFYRHPGMSSLGVVLFIGVFWCLVCSIILLPALLTWIKTSKKMNEKKMLSFISTQKTHIK